MESLQQDPDEWLYRYNQDRPYRGYSSQGRGPIETFEMGKIHRNEILKEMA